MTPSSRRGSITGSGLMVGILLFFASYGGFSLLNQEGLVTYLIRHSNLRGIAAIDTVRTASTTPEERSPAPEPEADHARPFALMIDNHPDALPQSGIAEASEVWQVLVEGGLTRLMAVYRGQSAAEIGPVRSARPYFVSLASGLDAVYGHVGGSDQALADLKDPKIGIDNADGITDGVTFTRDTSRSAPHNVYTSTDRMRALIGRRSWRAETKAAQPPRSAAVPTGSAAKDIVVSFGGGSSTVEFRYDPTTMSYRRLEAGRAGLDRDGTVERPATVVVIETDEMPISDPHGKGLIGIRTTGKGPAHVFRDGVELDGAWQRTASDAPMKVTSSDGKDIALAPGLVWYAVIATNRGGGIRLAS